MLLFVIGNMTNDLAVYLYHKENAGGKRHYLGYRERPPDHVGVAGLCEQERRGHEDYQLAGNGYYHRIYRVTQRLERRAEYDGDACKYERNADYPKRGHAPAQHLVVRLEYLKHLCGEYLHQQQTQQHYRRREKCGDLYRLYKAGAFACAVVVRDYRHGAVVKTEYGHENEALEFEIRAEYRLQSVFKRAKARQYKVEQECHYRGYRSHYDRGHAYRVNALYKFFFGTEAAHIDVYLVVAGDVEVYAEQRAAYLTHHRRDRRARNAHFRERANAEYQYRVEHDVDDCAKPLREHREDGLAGGLQQTFVHYLHKRADAQSARDVEVLFAVADSSGDVGLRAEIYLSKAEGHSEEREVAAYGEENSVPRELVRLFKLLFAQCAGEVSVDADARAHADGYHKILQRESERNACKSVLVYLRNE